MNEFKKGLRVGKETIYGKPENEFNTEIDTYRDYIREGLPGFIAFMETINTTLNTLEDNLIMSGVTFKARIKDAIGAVKNSDKKSLDDMFGMELVTPNEIDKEILMILIDKIYHQDFGYRENNYNKSNGYRAYHRIGSIKDDFGNEDFNNLEYYIMNKKTKKLKEEYKDMKTTTLMGMSREQREEFYEDVPLYPYISEQIKKDGAIDPSVIEVLQTAMKQIKKCFSGFDIKKVPITEIQFKTADVAYESVYGRASHANYKPVDESKIIRAYNLKKLMRGMHFPFKFQREDKKMKLQQSNITLIEMYPFLRKTMLDFKKRHPTPLLSFDMHFATVFPELKPYVQELKKNKKEPSARVGNTNADSIWRILKLKALNPDFSIPEYVKQIKKRKEGQGKEQ